MVIRTARFLLLLTASWFVMTLTHELGHIVGGTCCGGSLKSADLLPWHPPHTTNNSPFQRHLRLSCFHKIILGHQQVALLARIEWDNRGQPEIRPNQPITPQNSCSARPYLISFNFGSRLACVIGCIGTAYRV